MDEELIYPNPVARSDLPVLKPQWPRVVAGITAVLVLGTLFLPQIISSPIGRMFVKQYLAGKLNGEISLTGFKTSWFGGSSAEEIWVKTPDGHVVGAHLIRCEASLSKLLRGKYELGNCTVDQPYVDWVLDYGDMNHSDTFSRLSTRAPLPPGANVPPTVAPRVSGNVTVTGGVLNLMRGRVAPKTLQLGYRQVRFSGVNGTFSAKTFADAWKCDLAAKVGDDKVQSGAVQIFGNVGCGGTMMFSPAALQLALTVDCQNAPPALAAVCVPVMSVDDAKTALGDNIGTLHMAIRADKGKLSFAAFDMVADSSRLSCHPTIDLVANPCLMILNESTTATFALPDGELRQELVAVAPFLSAATDGGSAEIMLNALTVPLDLSTWRNLSATGTLTIRNSVLRAEPSRSEDPPKGIVSQLSIISGDLNPAPTLNIPKLTFKIEAGRAMVDASELTLGGRPMSVTSDTKPDKSLQMTVTLMTADKPTTMPSELSTKPVTVPVVGTSDAPRLDFDAASVALPPTIKPAFDKYLARQITQFRAHQAELEKAPHQKALEIFMKNFVTNETPADNP